MDDELLGPPADGVVETDVDGEVCLYAPLTHEALILNATASSVWKLSDGSLTVAQTIAALAETYDVAEDDIREDVYTVVEQLRQAGLLSSPLGSP